jgi:type IV fimbrial biogenesis protein FimT
MNRTIRLRSQSGFTLFELVIVMLIIGILAAIGVPSFKYITVSNRIATEINGLVGDLQYARSEAIKQGLPVTVCASTDGSSCANSATWTTGWIVFVDLNADKIVTNNVDAILRKQPALATGDNLVASSNVVTAIVFNREGYASTGATSTIVIELQSTPVNAQWTRCLAVTAIGGLTVERSGATQPTSCL